ncbi:hypothetical protein MPH_01119 [Macrophomina phaseolina MS6]|uniref:Uncharacterized protein n=1 Tax=Macrophomina phaseolina (strain MS6) TaxID=1126212 RepID=K2SY89_MACPH|nr:hypothetical protein MPH_01119 [Macrophomina phaseolina MS6]
MWAATGTAVAHAPNVTDLKEDDIGFDVHGHSAREADTATLRTAPTSADATEDGTKEPKATWTTVVRRGLIAAGRFAITPTGFFITVYGLNVVAWGAMLFFLLLKAAPAMNHPDGGDADSSPRKIWIEIDSQILNALFCLTAWGLAPWRFRDLWFIAAFRMGAGPESGRVGLRKLAQRNASWFRMREEDQAAEGLEKKTLSGKVAPPTAYWKLDFVVWMYVLNTLLQVGMAFMMWHYNRFDRPSWGSGLFIGLGCGVSLLAGIMCWWEGRKIKLIEGPKLVEKEAA